jgi:DNA-binding transcriptional LysR family regulator
MQAAFDLMKGRPPSLRLETLHETAQAIRVTGLPGLTLRIYAAMEPELTLFDPELPDNETALYLCYHETRRHDPLLQTVIAWATEAFETCEHL